MYIYNMYYVYIYIILYIDFSHVCHVAYILSCMPGSHLSQRTCHLSQHHPPPRSSMPRCLA